MLGAKGEEIVDDSVWLVKTHYPWTPAVPTQFSANKMMVVVRNPLDSIISWYHYLDQGNHTTKTSFDVARTYPGFFNWWVHDIVPKMRKQYGQYILEARERKSPILFVRFEDLIANPRPSLESTLRFLLSLEDLEGTNAARRLDQVLQQDRSATTVYTLKDSTLKPSQSYKNYTPAQLDYIRTELSEMLQFFEF